MLVFGVKGSRDASRQDSLKYARSVAGVKVPGRPEEPTNCCMSGCIDCVWEMYKEDIKDWKSKKKEARAALMARPDIKWPEELLGPEPKNRTTEQKETKQDTTVTPFPSDSCVDDGFESFDDDYEDDLNVSIKQFLKVEELIRKKKRAAKIAANSTTVKPSQNISL